MILFDASRWLLLFGLLLRGDYVALLLGAAY